MWKVKMTGKCIFDNIFTIIRPISPKVTKHLDTIYSHHLANSDIYCWMDSARWDDQFGGLASCEGWPFFIYYK